MGALFSKKRDDNNASQHTENSTVSQIPADISSYEAACQVDRELQTFDVALQERTSRVVNTLAMGVEVRSLSFDSLREVTTCLLEMNQEVVKVILECKKDIWKTPELFDLVEDYFENSLQTLDFCTALEKCLKRARDSQFLIQLALQQFEVEMGGDGPVEGKDFLKTLEELKNFKEAGDPFTQEFFKLFESVSSQQVLMLHKLHLQKRKLDRKLKTMKVWRRVSYTIFAAALVSVLICSVVAAAITAPPVVTAVAAAAAVPLGSMGKWFDSMWKGYENAVKGEREVIRSMQIGTFITIKDLDSIRVLVSKLEIEIQSLLQSAEFAIREDGAVKFAIDEIRKKLGMFMETIDDLSKHADKCSQDITRARTVVLQRIIRHPSSS